MIYFDDVISLYFFNKWDVTLGGSVEKQVCWKATLLNTFMLSQNVTKFNCRHDRKIILNSLCFQEMLDIPPVNSLNYADWFQKPVGFSRQLGT